MVGLPAVRWAASGASPGRRAARCHRRPGGRTGRPGTAQRPRRRSPRDGPVAGPRPRAVSSARSAFRTARNDSYHPASSCWTSRGASKLSSARNCSQIGALPAGQGVGVVRLAERGGAATPAGPGRPASGPGADRPAAPDRRRDASGWRSMFRTCSFMGKGPPSADPGEHLEGLGEALADDSRLGPSRAGHRTGEPAPPARHDRPAAGRSTPGSRGRRGNAPGSPPPGAGRRRGSLP